MVFFILFAEILTIKEREKMCKESGINELIKTPINNEEVIKIIHAELGPQYKYC